MEFEENKIPVLRVWLVLILSFSLVSCLNKKPGEPIVIPPGQLIEYSNQEFLTFSGEHYTVDLQKLDGSSKKFFSIEDLTPLAEKSSNQDVSFILPKDKNEPGVFIIKVNLPRAGINLSAFVLPGRKTNPNLATTLAVQLAENYPDKDLMKIGVDEVKDLEAVIQKSIDRIKLEFKFEGVEIDSKQWLRFVTNYVSRSEDFLDLADDYGYSFSTDSDGMPEGAPLPFGKANARPNLDLGNSTATTRLVTAREDEEVEITGKVIDPDADFILSTWFLEEKFHQSGGSRFKWTPGFFDSRADSYKVKLIVTDGGIPKSFEWEVQVFDKNRSPVLMTSCELLVKEWERWSCKVTAKDFDGDPVSYTVTDKNTFARVKVGGQETDNTTRKLKIEGQESIELEIIPDNRDAKKRQVPIEIIAEDGKLGQLFIPLPIIVEDVNAPPLMKLLNGSPILPFVAGDIPREWDYCSDEDPDGGLPYRFMIEVYDPDNLAEASPRNQHPDEMSVNIGGSLKSALTPLTEADGCPATTTERAFFCFEWKPKTIPRSGSLSLNLKDDHGGNTVVPSDTYPDPVVLTSEDRNVRPCLSGSLMDRVLSLNYTAHTDVFDSEDEDGNPPWPEIVDVPEEVMPLVSSRDASNNLRPAIFKKTFFNPVEWIHRFSKATGGASNAQYRLSFSAAHAGSVIFSRTLPHTAPVVIPAGFLLRTNTPTKKIQYQVASAVTLEPDDKEVMVPVKVYNRTVAAGKLNRFIVPPGFTVSVTNPTALTAGGTVTITRPTATTLVQIPASTELGTDEVNDGTDTVRYELVDNISLNVGVLSATANVRRQILYADPGTITLQTGGPLDGPAITVNNTKSVMDRDSYTLARDLQVGTTLGSDRFCWKRRGADSAVLGSTTELYPTLGGPLESGISYFPETTLGLEGWIQVRRTSSAGALSIPADYQLRARDATKYLTSESITIGAGQLTGRIRVRRTGHLTPEKGSETSCVGWSDVNFEPVFLNNTTANVEEGGTLTGFEFKVTDNVADTTDPRDYLDRHTFNITNIGNVPTGNFLFCRKPGDNPADINSPACTSCSTVAPTSPYFETTSCFLRYKPALQDVSERFSFNAQVDDHGLNLPVGTNIRNQSFTLNVIESNDPPVYTDNLWAALGNTNVASAVNLGEFLEGTRSIFRFYLTDPDKGGDLKTLIAPTLTRTWQFLAPAGWTVVSNPTGLITNLDGPSVFVAGGWGSRTTMYVDWTPNDADAKRFAGSLGGILEYSTCDRGTTESPRRCTTGFYGFTTRNLNNLPNTHTNISTITVNADTFSSTDFALRDSDWSKNPAANGGFQTYLSMCTAPGAYDCAADLTGWPATATQIDNPYAGNAAVTSCQSGGSLTAFRNPQFVRYNNLDGVLSGNLRYFYYRFQWCPQRRHIGTHTVFFNLSDNGDEDYRGVSSRIASNKVQIPLQLRVVAPVFFESPLRQPNPSILASHWQRHAYSLQNYRYPLLINSSKGNNLRVLLNRRATRGANNLVTGAPKLEMYSYPNMNLVASHDNTINNFKPDTHMIFISWRPYGPGGTNTHYISNPADQLTWPLFEVEVQDMAVAADKEKIQFRVQVFDPLATDNQPPVIASTFPAVQTFSIPEQSNQSFAITANDDPNNHLMYRWYLDGKFVANAGPSYNWLPRMDDAFLPTAKPGWHKIRVEVVDGQERTPNPSYTWDVYVRNTVPLPIRMTSTGTTPWAFTDSVVARFGAGTVISNLKWGPTIGVATTSGSSTTNHLLFTGSYLRSSLVRDFVWRLQFNQAVFANSTTNQGFDDLKWSPKKSEQISFLQSPTAVSKVRVSSVEFPNGIFGSTTDAVSLAPSLSTVPRVLPGDSCTGTCAETFFVNSAPPGQSVPMTDTFVSAGNNPFASYNENGSLYVFYSTSFGKKLEMARFGNPFTEVKNYTGNDQIASMAVNAKIKRLYVTVRDPAAVRNLIEVYDISSVSSGSISLLTILIVTDGVNPENRILDLVVDQTKDRVYALLPGTGGVAYFNDSSSTTPVIGDLQFIGVSNIGSSLNDQVGAGRKLVFNPSSQLLMGIAKDSSEVFIIDTMNDAFGIKIFRSEVGLDELVVYPNDGLALGINRELGRIYYIR